MERVKSLIRDVPDFPKPGILFKDITPIFQDPKVFGVVQDALYERLSSTPADVIAGIESRGFLFGAPLALRMGLPFVPVRKAGKLPWRTVSQSYDLEYGSATIEMHEDAVKPGQRVLMIDDLLATGGTAAAAVSLVRKMDAQVVECVFVIELDFLGGRKVLAPTTVTSLIRY
ncbi:adenine phosphoribosyltransferase [Myxococcota bacterium]|nr:adenine phosphoribosyltransferase [Myxococcota bacterium]